MSDTYFNLPSRMEDSFPEIDNDIVTDLYENNEEYAEIHLEIAELKRQFPPIAEAGGYGASAALLPGPYGCGSLSQENQSDLTPAVRNNPGRFS